MRIFLLLLTASVGLYLQTVNLFAQGKLNELPPEAFSDSTGWMGDNFSLEGALELFQKAKELEEFENRINDPESHINNLDLNEDGVVDYVRVLDNQMGMEHAIVLQVPVNANETQDIAVIEISKVSNDSAIVQIIGDQEVYGANYILEPTAEWDRAINQSKGPCFAEYMPVRWVMNVWYWPCIQFIYRPQYKPWNSPYYWQHYPPYWKPWKKHHWHQHWWYCHQIHHGRQYFWKSQSIRCASVHQGYLNRRAIAHSLRLQERNQKKGLYHQQEIKEKGSQSKVGANRDGQKHGGKSPKGNASKKSNAGGQHGHAKGHSNPKGGKKGKP